MSLTVVPELSVLDLGFSYTKAKRGNKKYLQPSLTGEPRSMFKQNIESNHFLYNDELFIGELAQQYSDVKYFSLKDNKTEAMTSDVIMKTALGYLNHRDPFNLVTGLPVLFYFNQLGDMENMIGSLSDHSTYSIKKGNHIIEDIKLNINNFNIVPQGYGIAMSFLLDKNGEIINKHIARKKILVIDLGFYTLNLLGLDKLSIMKESTSEILGVEKAYKLLRKYLMENVGKAPSIYEMDKYVRTGIYEGFNIKPLIKKSFRAIANQIQNEVEGLNIKFDYYFIGGGAAHRIFDMLDLPNKMLFNQLAQIDGYQKTGVRSWR
ncbi:ParM/StbA family protein [Paenibacillus xylanexedens]|uniref:ParM/StbA family protein n=1 Tax=Paenibacillus xylanexedens TaxID=528191 RepID=UPI00119E55C8|nr:ParM/StbA family protein [Paenibacillus xylanexedens]